MARNRLLKATRRSGLIIQLECKVRCGEEQTSGKRWEFSARLTMQQHWATPAMLTFSASETRNLQKESENRLTEERGKEKRGKERAEGQVAGASEGGEPSRNTSFAHADQALFICTGGVGGDASEGEGHFASVPRGDLANEVEW